jgi:hypothetical protein
MMVMWQERRLIEARRHELFELVLRNGSHRKCRLLIAACLRRLGQDEIAALCERVADGAADAEELHAVRYRPWVTRFLTMPRRTRPTRVPPSDQLREFVWQALHGDPRFGVTAAMEVAAELLREEYGRLLRDVLGNPAPPVVADPRWLTSTVVDLARVIYEQRDFERLPVLADALMDAGCDSEELLAHCRSEGPHVRGCWVVDLLTGRE